MSSLRKQHFDALTQQHAGEIKSGIWELPDSLVDTISGAADFAQGNNFAQNFSCFAQNIGNFSQGTPPVIYQTPTDQ